MNSETIIMLKRELQAYYNNAGKGGAYRRRNMILLRWDIHKLEESNKVNIGMCNYKSDYQGWEREEYDTVTIIG